MGWLTRLREWVTHLRVERSSHGFLPHEWNEYFASLAFDKRRVISVDLCREAATRAGPR